MASEMKPPHEPRPSGWDAWCRDCRSRTAHGHDDIGQPWCLVPDCMEMGGDPKTLRALWGHEWAAVAMMAQSIHAVAYTVGLKVGLGADWSPSAGTVHAVLMDMRAKLKLPPLETSIWLRGAR